jgi:hypothetical protein
MHDELNVGINPSAKENIPSRNKQGLSPLHIFQIGRSPVREVLIDKGSIVTRLRFAGRENDAISVIAPASLPEKWGQSFVEWLLYSNQKVNVRLLLVCDMEGITA